jgi:predicted DsbA family dithiol-disulfide isomerase/uncharacterized membrane protein
MVGLSIYLTNHFFELHYPTGLSGKSLCNLSGFFSCDSASFSPASSLLKVPISVFGLLFSLILLFGTFITSKAIEGTNHFLIRLNFVGCISLGIYSIIALHTLCPVCAIYYLFSGFMAVLYFKGSTLTKPSLKILAIYAVVVLIGAGITYATISGKEKNNDILKQGLISQYDNLPNVGLPSFESPYALIKSTEKFSDAPIKLLIFSDFECPACKALADYMPKVIARYKGHINILYNFYPLDNSCNPRIPRPMHQNACHAARLASCFTEDFNEIHDEIFDAQDELSSKWITNFAKAKGKEDCVKNQAATDMVLQTINLASQYEIKSTPTLIVNGVKIEGVLPLNQLFILLDELLLRNGKK